MTNLLLTGDKMERGEFYINGKSFFPNVWITNLPTISYPLPKVSKHSIVGSSREVVIDEGGYDNRTCEFQIAIRGRTYDELDLVRAKITNEFLQTDYVPVVFYNDPKYYFEATLTDQLKPTDPIPHNAIGFYDVKLTMGAYKYARETNEVKAQQSLELLNDFYFASAPLITLYGTGNQTLTVNGKDYRIKNMAGSISLDSDELQQDAYSPETGVSLMAQIAFNSFPTLQPGKNEIFWTGASFKIDPRWRTI